MPYPMPNGDAVDFELSGAAGYAMPTGNEVGFSFQNAGLGQYDSQTASLPALVGAGAGASVGAAEIPLIVGAGSTPKNQGAAPLPTLRGVGVGGESSLNRQLALLPSFIGSGSRGAVAAASLPKMDANGHGDVSGLGRQFGRIPSLAGAGFAFVGAVGRQLGAVLPALTGSGATSAVGATSELPALIGDAAGVVGAVGRQLGAALPRFQFAGSMRAENYGRGYGLLPALTMPRGARGAAQLPPFVGSGMASFGLSHGWTTAWALQAIEAYVMGIDAAGDAVAYPVTRYTSYPFIRVVRLGDRHYGIAPDGIHLIGGSSNNGQPIAWEFQTHVADSGSGFKKTVASAYLGGTIGASVRFKVLTGEHPDQLHAHSNTFLTHLRNHREKFGKGRKARYWAFGLSSPTGAPMMMDSLDLEIFEMTRRI